LFDVDTDDVWLQSNGLVIIIKGTFPVLVLIVELDISEEFQALRLHELWRALHD